MATSLANEVVVNIAAVLIAQQYDHIVAQYNLHLCVLQDYFDEGVWERWNEFDVCCRLAAPLIPLGSQEVNTMESRFHGLLQQYRQVSEQEIVSFIDSCETTRTEMCKLLARLEEDGKAAQRKNADELFSVTNLCRREVAATIALVRTQHAATETEVAAVKSLQQALTTATAECENLRQRLDQSRQQSSAMVASIRKQLEDERGEFQRALFEERTQISEKVKAMMDQQDKERTHHFKEMMELNAVHATAMEKLRAALEERSTQLQALQAENDDLRKREIDLIRDHANERHALQQTISNWEVDYEALKLQMEKLGANVDLAQLRVERGVEAQKRRQVEEFKRRLADVSTVHPPAILGSEMESPAAQPPPHAAAATIDRAASRSISMNQQQQIIEMMGARGVSTSPAALLSTGAAPFSSRNASAWPLNSETSKLQPVARIASTSVVSPPYRDLSSVPRALSPSVASLRAPSEAYLRLQNLASNLRVTASVP